jgi:hypothetical protein
MSVKSKTTHNNTKYIFLIGLIIQSEFQILVKIAKLEIGEQGRRTIKCTRTGIEITVDDQLSSSTTEIWIIASKEIDLVIAVIEIKTVL